VCSIYIGRLQSGKPRQRTARTEHNLHPQERRLNRALDVEIFGKSGNESYEMAKIMAMRWAGEGESGQGWLPSQSNCEGLARATVRSHSREGLWPLSDLM